MKKLFLLVLLGFLGVYTASAQCKAYSFAERQGTYAALSGEGLVTRTVTAGTALDFILLENDVRAPFPTKDSAVTAGIDLGFDFTFCEKVYDKVVITASGYLILGEKGRPDVAVTGTNAFYRHREWTDRAIGLVGTAGSTLPQALEGTAYRYIRGERDGQKTFAVEFVKIGYVAENGTGTTSADLTYTVTLCEDKSVDFDFGDMTGAADWYLKFSIGLNNAFSDKHFRQPKESDNSWAETEMTTNTNSVVILADKFPKGRHWTFSYPVPCEKPVATDLKVTFEEVSATEFTYVVSSEEKAFDGVMVVFSTEPLTEADEPEDGVVYQYDDDFGSGIVHNVGALPLRGCTLDDWDDIAPSSTYYITVFPYNNLCTGGIKYGPGVEGVIHTPTTAPEALDITAFDGKTFELGVTKNELDEDVAVVVTTRLGASSGGRCAMIGQFGPVPEGVQEGDELETADGGFGGKVIYVGSGDGKITYGDLSPNTIYHFAAFSKGVDGRYSIEFAQADDMTAPVFPLYEDFTQHPCNATPYKWADTKGFKRNSGDSYLSSNVNWSGGVLAMPEFDLPAGNLRLVLEYYMAYVEGREEYAYTTDLWSDTDSIVLEISQGNGDFVGMAAITKANADDMKKGVFLKRNLAFKLAEAAPSKVRIRWTQQFEKGPTVQVQSVRLLAEPTCDYPHEVTVPVAALTGSTAEVHWVPGISEETRWNVSYACLTDGGEADWSEPREVDARPFTLRDLEAQTAYQVRVQAVCGIGSTSDWTYSAPFETNATIPMKEDFNTLRRHAQTNRWTFNQGWLEGQAGLTETVLQSDMALNPSSGALALLEWKQGGGFQSGVNGSVAYITSYQKNTWLMLPDLDFGQGGEGARLTFDVALPEALGNEEAAKTVKMYVFRSVDGGQTYRAADSLAAFDWEKINAFGDSTRVTVPLDVLQGHQRLAFFLTSQYDRFVRLYIDNVEVYATRATPKDLRYSNLTKSSVDLQWRADAHVESWVVKVESVDGLRLEETQTNAYTLTGLSGATAYRVSVGHVCAPADTVWSSVNFTTGGIRCDAVIGLTAAEVSKTTATLKWTGTAAKYNVQIAKKGDDNWTIYTTDKPAYAVSNLIPGTAYVWRVQSVCGEAVEDRSDYTAAVEFTTAAITCLPPTGLSVDEVSYYSVTLKWTATAGTAYQVSFKKEKDLAYGVAFAAVENPLRIKDLNAETSYQFRVRQVCGAGDTSAWSEPVQATTTVFIPCESPTDLKSESVTATSFRLSWKAEGNLSCILRYRASSATVWDSVKELTEQRYMVENLQPNTAYVWSVMSLCDNNRFSDWARQADFTTGSVANESALAKAFRVYASKGQLHILNPDQIGMERVELYDRVGRRMQSHVVRTTGNVVIPMDLGGESILVRVIGMDARVAVYKIRL